MESPKNDIVADNDRGILEECEDLVAGDNAYTVSSGCLNSKIRSVMEWVASRSWGQMVFKSVDRFLWCVERTLMWQNPDKVALSPMVRPVNVLLAYPLATFLWIIQHLLFYSADTSSAVELIKWVQTRRRRLRAVRYQGIRNMRGQVAPVSSWLSRIFWSPAENLDPKLPTKVGEKDEKEIIIEHEIEESEHSKKRRFSSLSMSIEDGTIVVDEDYNSESDADYVPECSLSSESSDSELSSVGEDEEGDLNQSVRENESTEETATPQISSNGHLPQRTA